MDNYLSKILKTLVLFSTFLFLNLNLYAQNVENDTTIYTITETQPEFPNGLAAFMQFISQNFKIPEQIKETGIERPPYFDFIIEKDGSISSFSMKKNEEVWRTSIQELVSKMPRWKPAKLKGQEVRCHYTLRISCIKLE